MGLDQWIYKISKIEDNVMNDIKGMNEKEVCRKYGNDISVWKIDERLEELVEPIKDILQKTEIIFTEYNMEKIYKELGIDDTWHMGYWSSVGHGIDMRFYPERKETDVGALEPKEFHISAEDEKDYLIDVPHEAYLLRKEEIAYYRKNYDIQEDMYDKCDFEIENCGYYPLNADMKAALRKRDNGIRFPRCKKAEMLVYHEWY